jgi:hypothetical protein
MCSNIPGKERRLCQRRCIRAFAPQARRAAPCREVRALLIRVLLTRVLISLDNLYSAC